MAGKFIGLVHKNCGGLVAPALVDDVTEEELRGYVEDSAICMRCGEPAPADQLEAEFDDD